MSDNEHIWRECKICIGNNYLLGTAASFTRKQMQGGQIGGGQGPGWAARKLKVWAGNWDSNRWASEWIVSSSSQIKVSEKDVERV